jgi:hypothetical protein
MHVGDKAQGMAGFSVHSMRVCELWIRAGHCEQSLSICVCVRLCVF